jgi:hypothetical protein
LEGGFVELVVDEDDAAALAGEVAVEEGSPSTRARIEVADEGGLAGLPLGGEEDAAAGGPEVGDAVGGGVVLAGEEVVEADEGGSFGSSGAVMARP